MIKNYVLDTNILMQNPNALYGFDDNNVIITGMTLQELDKHKTGDTERAFNARESIRILESLRQKGNLLTGVPIANKGKLSLYMTKGEKKLLPHGYDLSIPDNTIIQAVLELYDKCPETYLITNDISMRVNATICGVKVQGYRNETVEDEEEYTGRTSITVPKDIIDELYCNKEVSFKSNDLEINQFVLAKDETNLKHTALAIYRKDHLFLIDDIYTRGFGGIKGKNAAQKMLMYALLAPAEEIPLVVVNGPAGTGKTLLSIACGLEQTYDAIGKQKYDTCLITRSNTLSDNDIGFLPGSLENKMDPLVAPFYDNMQHIFAGDDHDLEVARQQIEYVMQNQIVKIASLAYMRGRSLERTFLIVDEAQNLTVKQALEIVTRCGMNSKVVLLGDPTQIDSRFIDKKTNGLVFTASKMRGSELCAQITFGQEEAVRSPLAMEAAKRMTV